jgi:hypothetical protein
MYIKDLTTEEFQELIKVTVVETLKNYLIDPDDQLQISTQIQEKLLKISRDRCHHDQTLSKEEAYQLLNIEFGKVGHRREIYCL